MKTESAPGTPNKNLKVIKPTTVKYKATEKFKELGIENNYQFLTVEQYFNLLGGRITEIQLSNRNQYLIKDGYIEKVNH
jgi:hypothetical protein